MAPNSKKNRDSETSKILLMLKLNANRVYNRIDVRMPEYLDDFAMKRTRKYFPEVFNHKFNEVQLETLAKADTETIIALENYFNKVDDLKWYMDHTEDMPNTVEDRLGLQLKKLAKLLETLNLYLDAELGFAAEAESDEGEDSTESEVTSTIELENDDDDDDDDDDIPSLRDL